MGVLGTARAVADVPFEQVRPFLTAERCRVLLGREVAGVSVDVDGDTVGMQGQFWYRGEYTFAPYGEGTEVTYRIHNVSGRPDGIIRIWQRKALKDQQRAVEAFAAELPRRVG